MCYSFDRTRKSVLLLSLWADYAISGYDLCTGKNLTLSERMLQERTHCGGIYFGLQLQKNGSIYPTTSQVLLGFGIIVGSVATTLTVIIMKRKI
jgi:hypothetical protein